MSQSTNRRRFLQTTAISGVGFWVAGGARAKPSKSPNGRIAFASIGVGGKGSSDSDDAAKAGDLVAICDVDEHILNNAGQQRFPKAKRYTDFRKMLDEMGSSIDAVTVSTPDHCHAPAALMAMRMGKHCFCQKPLTRTIYEARLMARVAKQTKVATQMGNQGTSFSPLRKAAAVVKSGVLGLVKEVHVWTNRPIWAQGGNRGKSIPCPKRLAWNLWLGPSPLRPYASGYHQSEWRGWWDFGSGALGDMACHTVNMPYMALDLRDPNAIQAETSGHNGDSYPKWSVITFDFPARNGRPPVKLFWYDGGKLPEQPWMAEMRDLFKEQIAAWRILGKNYLSAGCVIVGEKDRFFVPGDYAEGTLKLSGNKPLPPVEFKESPGHFEEWVRAIQGGEPAMSNFPGCSGSLTENILLGNLAVWAAATGKGERVEWDAKNLQSTNFPALQSIIKPTYRAGYTLDVA